MCLTAARAQSPKAVMDYVEKYKKIAIEEMKLTGIPASVTLAQGIHESGCGLSPLALNSNNHFGIKCHNEWTGITYHHDDDLPQECFRVYACAEESFKDHSDFLKTRPRYAFLFKLDPTDYKGWARGLKAAGYATNPKYPEIIIKLIEDYKLSDYDKGIDRPAAQPMMADATKSKQTAPVVQTAQAAQASAVKAITTSAQATDASKARLIASTEQTAQVAAPKTATPSALQIAKPIPAATPQAVQIKAAPIQYADATTKPKLTTPEVAMTKSAATQAIQAPPLRTPSLTVATSAIVNTQTASLATNNKDAQPLRVQLDERLINGTKAVVYKSNIPIDDIAKKYSLTTDQLYAYNDLQPTVKPKDGEYIYLEKKKTETSYYQYEVAEGETMRDVAQKFGVQLASLYKRNGITQDCEPLSGEVVVLRGNREVPMRFHVVDRTAVRKSIAELPSPTTTTTDTKYHKVNNSDTLYSIARQYNIPVDDLIKLNDLKDSDIKIGQTLLVTEL
jgi:LysM repeat protein